VRISGSQIACPDYGSGLSLRLSGFEKEESGVSFFRRAEGRKVTVVISFRGPNFVLRGSSAIDISWEVAGLVTVDGNRMSARGTMSPTGEEGSGSFWEMFDQG